MMMAPNAMSVAQVSRGPVEPASSRMRFNGEMAVGLGIVPKARVNVLEFGQAVRASLEKLRPDLAPLEVHPRGDIGRYAAASRV